MKRTSIMRIISFLYICLILAAGSQLVFAGSTESKTDSGSAEYFAVFMEGKKVGHAIQSRVVSEGKVTTSERVSITISRTGIAVTVKTNETSIETIDGKPLGFKVEQMLGPMAMKISGTVDKEGSLHLSMGNDQNETQQWPSGAVMSEGLRLLELEKGLKEGQEYEAKVYSPSILQAVTAKISIGPRSNIDLLGRVVALTEIKTSLNLPLAGPIVATEYVDDNHQVQKAITPAIGMNIEMVACTKEFALSENDVFDVVDKMFIASPESINNISSAESITYHLTYNGNGKLMIPSTDNQQVEILDDSRVIVTVKPIAAPDSVRFPYTGNDEIISGALEPTRFVQSDNEKIVKLAKQAVGDTTDVAEAAKRIEAFVGDYVENRSLSVGYASAAEVAESRQGDCSEFSVLTTAMCRAVGIPAQVVVGVAYVRNFADMKDQFGGHAWVQAYIGGKWVGLDSSFKGAGRGGYDAGHIALAVGNGNPEDFFNMVSTMGQFKIEKIVVNRK
jgi:hypothetical protein